MPGKVSTTVMQHSKNYKIPERVPLERRISFRVDVYQSMRYK
jgi:hypothetical protein